MEKLNLTKTDPTYYKASIQPDIIALEDKKYISLIGLGAPEYDRFQRSIEIVYAVAYAVKKIYKNQDQDFVVPKMEAFWWIEGDKPFEEASRDEWHWEVMIRLPDFVDQKTVEKAIKVVIDKKGAALVSEVYYKKISAHQCAQALHIGSYEEEQETIGKIMTLISQEKYKVMGRHKEIYITDPRKTSTEKLRTILRYEVR